MIKLKLLALPVMLLAAGALGTQLANGQCAAPPPALAAWWAGEENTADSAGANTGVLRNGATYAPGKVGQAFALDGTNAFVEFPAAAAATCTTAISVEAWILSSSAGGAIVSQYNSATDSGRWWFEFTNDGKLFFGVYGDTAVRYSMSQQVVVPLSTWTHVGATFDASTQEILLYANGVQTKANLLSPGIVPFIRQKVEPVRVGAYICADGSLCNNFTGLLDEVSIYSRALTASEFAAIYAAGNAGKCKSTPLAIVTQPQSQLGYWGKSVSFSVSATNGAPPYGYQWQKDGMAISDATNSVLVLANLQVTNAGVYTVVVSDTVTNLASQPATLTVNPAGVGIALYAGVTVDGVVGQVYGIQSTLDLSNTNSWVGRTNLTLTTPTYLWYDSNPATQPQTYYRVLPGPIPIP